MAITKTDFMRGMQYPATDSGLPNRNMMAQKGNETTYID